MIVCRYPGLVVLAMFSLTDSTHLGNKFFYCHSYHTYYQEHVQLMFHISVAAITQSDINIVIPPVPVNIVKPTVNVPVSVPTSSWKPDQWATWPFITITGVSGSCHANSPQNCAKHQPSMITKNCMNDLCCY